MHSTFITCINSLLEGKAPIIQDLWNHREGLPTFFLARSCAFLGLIPDTVGLREDDGLEACDHNGMLMLCNKTTLISDHGPSIFGGDGLDWIGSDKSFYGDNAVFLESLGV